MRVDLFLMSPQGIERYRHEGSRNLARDLFWGPIPTLEFVRSQPRVALHAPLGEDEQCDGAALLDLTTRTLTWFGGEDERLDVPLRRVHLRLMRAVWTPWTVQWAHGGLKQLAAAVGLPAEARRPPTRVLTLQQEHSARDIILTVRHPDGRTHVHTVGWDTPHGALCSHDRRWLHQLTDMDGDETWQRPRCLVPTGGVHIDLAARSIAAWQAEAAYDAAQRLTDAWRGWHTTWWKDRFEWHLAASGTPLRQFKTVVLEALKVADPRVVRLGAPQIPTWHSGGTDAQLLADVKDLINAMAEATGRSDSLHFSREEEDTSMNSLGMTWSSCVDCMKSLCCCGTRSDTEQYAVYISCDPEEASDVARYLQCALTRKFALPVVQEIGPELKDDCIEDQLNLGVARSHALLLLLSSGVFSRPWTLLQVYEAIRLHKPIVCVEVQGGGHNHGAAKAWLKSLRTELGKRLLSRLHARTLFSDPSLASLKRRPQPSWRDDRDAPHPPRARQLVPTIARSPLLRHPLHHRHLVHTKRLSEPCRRGACRHLRAVSKREAGVISQLECAAEEVLGRDQAQPVVRRDPAR